MVRIYWNLFLCFISLFIFYLFCFFNKSFFGFFFFEIFNYSWFNIRYFFAIDGISVFFVLLSSFLLSLCIIICWFWTYRLKFYLLCIGLSMLCLINIFLTLDIFILFFFFELIILPLFLLVGIWGSRERKIYASYLLFIYTLLGSAFALFAFLILYSNKGSSNFLFYLNNFFFDNLQIFLFVLIFLGFAVKVPMVPIHIWLPEAHVEAPTVGSVILAGIVLKLGFYVYLRLLVFTFSSVFSILIGIVFMFTLLGLYIPSFSAIAQLDMKKIIAYSSISHMNFSLIGLFSYNFIAVYGAFFMMFGHAIVSGALFSCIGVIYDRYKTRILFYYGGLVLLMPLWAISFFIFILGNIGLPGTVNFVGELMIFIGSFINYNLVIIFSLFGLFLTLVYSLMVYTRIVNGGIKVFFIRFFSDISRREFFILSPLFFFTIFLGLYPNLMFDFSFSSIFYWLFFS